MENRWALLLCAVVCVAAGVFPMLDALDVFPDSAARLNAPRWVALVVASLFIAAGFYVLLLALAGAAGAMAFGKVLGMAIFVGLAAVIHWIAFGSGERGACSGGVSAMGIGVSGPVPDWECRAVFGYGALLMDFMFLRGTAWWLARRDPAGRSIRVIEKVSEWGVGLMLLPLVLLAWLLTSGKERAAALIERLRSRATPAGDRNRSDGSAS
jgi:hypothetical protein